jgi:hypothetical protein
MDVMGVLDPLALLVPYQKIFQDVVPVVAYPVVKIDAGHVMITSIYLMAVALLAQLGANLVKMEFVKDALMATL